MLEIIKVTKTDDECSNCRSGCSPSVGGLHAKSHMSSQIDSEDNSSYLSFECCRPDHDRDCSPDTGCSPSS